MPQRQIKPRNTGIDQIVQPRRSTAERADGTYLESGVMTFGINPDLDWWLRVVLHGAVNKVLCVWAESSASTTPVVLVITPFFNGATVCIQVK